MKPHPYFLFDGSFAGFLNTIQKGLEESHPRIALNLTDNTNTLPLFGSGIKIETKPQKAKRMWEDLGLLGTEFQKRVYYSFLYENAKIRPEVYRYVAHLFCPEIEGIDYGGIQAGKQVDLAVGEVSRERAVQERGLSFKSKREGIWYSTIRPKHDILPLLSRYCRSRFSSDPWMVVDTTRKKTLCSVSGKLTLVVSPNHVSPESNTFLNPQRAAIASENYNTTSTAIRDFKETRSLLPGKTRKWETEWGQEAV